MQTYAEYSPTGFDRKGAFLTEQGDWLVLPCGRNRDSDHLSESNFETALEMLGGESETVEVHNFGHWACGWFEIIIVKPDTPAAEIAESIEARLSDYPVLNESDWSEREYNSYNEQWASWGCSDFKREILRKFATTYDDAYDELESRLDAISDGALQEFFESLNESGDWHDDGSPNIHRSIDNCSREDLDDWLAEMASRADSQGTGELSL